VSAVANVAVNLDSRGVPAKLKQIADRGKEVDRSLNGAAAATTKAGREIKTAANGMQYFTDAAGRARKVNGQFVTSTEAAAAGIKKQDTAARSLIGTMTKLAATAGAGRVAAGITRTAAGFEEELRRAAAIEGGGNMDQLRQSIERVASTAAGTPTEVAALATSLSRAGFTAQETSESLQGIVTGAEATSVAFDQLGSIVSSSLRSFGLATSDTASVVDTLVQTANSSQQTILDLGEALSYAAPGARTLGISISDLSATIGLLADNGIRGSRAGTSLSTGLDRLQLAASGSQETLFEITRGSAMLTKAMDTLGSQVLDAEGNLKPLDEVLLALKRSLDQLSVGQRVELTKALFGQEAGRGFQALLANSEEKIRSMFETIENAQGKTEQVREEMRGFSDSMKVLGGNVENTTNAIGDKFIVVLQPLVDGLNATLKAASELPKPIRDIAAAAAAAGIAAGGLALALKTLIPTVKLLAGLLGIGGLAGAMAALPWVAAAAGAAALGVAFYNLSGESMGLTDVLQDSKNAMKDLAAAADLTYQAVKPLADGIGYLVEQGGGIPGMAQAAINSLIPFGRQLTSLLGLAEQFMNVMGLTNQIQMQRAKEGLNAGMESGDTPIYNSRTGKYEWNEQRKAPAAPSGSTRPFRVGDTISDSTIAKGSAAAGRVKETDAERAAKIKEIRAIETKIYEARSAGNEVLALQLEAQKAQIEIQQRGLGVQEETQLLLQNGERLTERLNELEKQRLERLGQFLQGTKELVETQNDVISNYQQETNLLEMQAQKGEAFVQKFKDINKLMMEGGLSFSEAFSQVEERTAAMASLNKEADMFQQALAGAGDIIGNQLRGAIDGLIDGTADWNNILRDTLGQLGSFFLNFGLNQLAGPSGSGGILSFLGFGRASGGPVRPGGTYMVGERGPELLTMTPSGGYVTSNSASQAAMNRYSSGNTRGGSISVNYNVTEINGMKFVTEDQFRAGISQAAKQGAEGGFNRTMTSLKNSRSIRSRVGV
jgi:TP901 family phage tail tape measure protein